MDGENPRSSGSPPCVCCHLARAVKRRRIDDPDGDVEVDNAQPCVCVRPPLHRVSLAFMNSSDDDFSEEDNDSVSAPTEQNVEEGGTSRNGTENNTESQSQGHVASENLPATASLPAQSPEERTPAAPQNLSFNISNVLSRRDELGWQESRPNLTQRAGYLLNNSRMSDIRFLVGELKTEICAHKTILALGSPVFEAQFFGAVGQGAVEVVDLPDMEPEPFLLFLKYLYTDELDQELDDAQLLSLLRPAKKYIVPHLVDKCIEILMTAVRPENAFQILHHAQFFQLIKLERACERYIDRNANAIVISEEFTNLAKPVLTDFLKRDGLHINEETLFQSVLGWATAECQRNSIEANYENLRSVLGECLRLIRFPTMTKEQFAVAYERSSILSAEEACSIFVYMCKSDGSTEGNLLFPVTRRHFNPPMKLVSRFGGEPTEHSLNYRSGEIYNYRVNFKIDRHIFLKGVNIFSIRCSSPGPMYQNPNQVNKRDFHGALYLYEKSASSVHEGRKQFQKQTSLEPDEAGQLLNGGRRHYFPVMFDSEIALEPKKVYTVCVVVSVSSNTYQAQPLQTYVGTHERSKASYVFQEDSVAVNFTFLGSSADSSVGRFTSAQIPEFIFSL